MSNAFYIDFQHVDGFTALPLMTHSLLWRLITQWLLLTIDKFLQPTFITQVLACSSNLRRQFHQLCYHSAAVIFVEWCIFRSLAGDAPETSNEWLNPSLEQPARGSFLFRKCLASFRLHQAVYCSTSTSLCKERCSCCLPGREHVYCERLQTEGVSLTSSRVMVFGGITWIQPYM